MGGAAVPAARGAVMTMRQTRCASSLSRRTGIKDRMHCTELVHMSAKWIHMCGQYSQYSQYSACCCMKVLGREVLRTLHSIAVRFASLGHGSLRVARASANGNRWQAPQRFLVPRLEPAMRVGHKRAGGTGVGSVGDNGKCLVTL